MKRFSKRALADAIGAAFRAPFFTRAAQPARPARRKPLFEQLEPRILLSAELPVIPPPPAQQDPVLAAPLVIGNSPESTQLLAASLMGAAAPQGPQLVQFQDGFASAQLHDETGAGLVLDFSAVKGNLEFVVAADGSVTVSDGTSTVSATGAVTLVGGAGDDTFRVEKIPDAPLAIETGGRGKDTLDFSSVHEDLTYTTHADGSVTVSAGGGSLNVDCAVATIGGQGRNIFVEEKAPSIAGTLNGGTFSSAASHLSLAAYVATQPAPRQVVIVDSAVQDYQSLLKSLTADTAARSAAQAAETSGDDPESQSAVAQAGEEASTQAATSAGDDILVIVLDPEWDGVEQITQVLAAFQGLAAVHILSHG